jgi:TfoX/Sxy family transcriptional regulator of competence genes
MPYDPGLAERLEGVVAGRRGMVQKKMFGGIGWMLNGNMCVGVYKDFLIIRIGEEMAAALSREPGVGPMDITGKPMKGWLMVGPDAYEDDTQLNHYANAAIAFVKTLPAKD